MSTKQIEQIEDDLDRHFRDKLADAVRHLSAMYDVAGLREGRAEASAAAECLRMATWLVTRASNMPKDEWLKITSDMFDSARKFQKRV